MILTPVHNEIPVWEVTDFDLPHVDWTDTGHLDQGNNNPVKQLRRHCAIDPHNNTHAKFTSSWNNHIAHLENFLSEEAEKNEFIKPIWMGRMKNIKIDTSPDILNDLPGFNMSRHIDNRFVLGVLIINLQDNPNSTCTNFWSNDWEDTDPWYKSPIKKGTGVFMLNNWNTRHSIEISADETETRLIGYQTINIPAIV